MLGSQADFERIATMPLAPQALRFPVQIEGRPAEIAAWVFAPPAQALGPEPVILHLYPGATYDKRYWHFVPHPQDGSYSFAQYLVEQFRCIVVACDHLGTGESTRPVSGWALTLDVLADAQAQVAEQIRALLRAGTLAPHVPGQDAGPLVGIGHSMGALVLHRVQARFHPYDCVAFLGFTHHPVRAGSVDEAALARTWHPSAQGYIEMTPERRRDVRSFFYLGDVPQHVIETDEQQCTDLPGGILADFLGAGAVQADAVRITAPVFLGTGSHDLSADPDQDGACYAHSPAVTLYRLAGSAHCHNLAPTRRVLWTALGEWIGRLSARHGSYATFGQSAQDASDNVNHAV